MSKALTNFYRYSRNTGGKSCISAIIDPSTQELTYDESRIAMIFSQHHQSKTDDETVDETVEPELNSPKMFSLAEKYNLDLRRAFPPQPDDKEEEVTISLKKLKSLITNLKGDTAPGKSGVDKHVLAWFIEYFPNILLEAFNFLLANPD